MLYKCNGLPSLCSLFATRVTAEFAQFTEKQYKGQIFRLLYMYINTATIFSQVKTTIEIFLLSYH